MFRVCVEFPDEEYFIIKKLVKRYKISMREALKISALAVLIEDPDTKGAVTPSLLARKDAREYTSVQADSTIQRVGSE